MLQQRSNDITYGELEEHHEDSIVRVLCIVKRCVVSLSVLYIYIITSYLLCLLWTVVSCSLYSFEMDHHVFSEIHSIELERYQIQILIVLLFSIPRVSYSKSDTNHSSLSFFPISSSSDL